MKIGDFVKGNRFNFGIICSEKIVKNTKGVETLYYTVAHEYGFGDFKPVNLVVQEPIELPAEVMGKFAVVLEKKALLDSPQKLEVVPEDEEELRNQIAECKHYYDKLIENLVEAYNHKLSELNSSFEKRKASLRKEYVARLDEISRKGKKVNDVETESALSTSGTAEAKRILQNSISDFQRGFANYINKTLILSPDEFANTILRGLYTKYRWKLQDSREHRFTVTEDNDNYVLTMSSRIRVKDEDRMHSQSALKTMYRQKGLYLYCDCPEYIKKEGHHERLQNNKMGILYYSSKVVWIVDKQNCTYEVGLMLGKAMHKTKKSA